MDYEHVIALDPATLSGYAVFHMDPENRKAVYVDGGVVKVEMSSCDIGAWCIDYQNKLRMLISSYTVGYCFVEDYFFSKRSCTGANVNAYLRAAVFMLCSELNIPYSIFTPTHWKSYVTGGRSKPTPQEVKNRYGGKKALANKQFIVDALLNRFKIRFPEHTIVGSKRLKFKYDVSDAVGIGIYGISRTYPGWVVVSTEEHEYHRHQLQSTPSATASTSSSPLSSSPSSGPLSSPASSDSSLTESSEA